MYEQHPTICYGCGAKVGASTAVSLKRDSRNKGLRTIWLCRFCSKTIAAGRIGIGRSPYDEVVADVASIANELLTAIREELNKPS